MAAAHAVQIVCPTSLAATDLLLWQAERATQAAAEEAAFRAAQMERLAEEVRSRRSALPIEPTTTKAVADDILDHDQLRLKRCGVALHVRMHMMNT